MNNNSIKFEHISIRCLIRALVRDFWMIVAAALIFAMSTSLYFSWFHVPRYQADMTYAVTTRVTSSTSSYNSSATKEVTATLTELLGSNMVRNKIRTYSEDLSDFDGAITARQVGDSNMIIVSATDDSPKTAFLTICAVADLFPTIVGYVSYDCIVQVIRNPDVSETPVNFVNSGKYCVVAAAAGAVLMAALLCWLCITRGTIQTRAGARALLDAPIIATISREQRKRTLRQLLRPGNVPLQVFSPATGFDYTEQINTICAQMELENANNGSKIFIVTGVNENEGKSTVAGNIAAAMAMRGRTVALVDCDLRNPSLCRFYDNKYIPAVPLNKLLSRPFSKEQLLQCMVRFNQMDLYLLFSQMPDRRCTELLTSATMQTLLLQLRVFDYVILDTPPMGYFADTETLLDSVDASMLVVRQDRTPAADINDAIDLLRSSNSRFMGCILNDMTDSITDGSSYGHYSHYGYGVQSGRDNL
ncbi:MAG: CpsD/CapB family tyrosine-protein kinase [Oscillospiraceae bacterium]|nr:CpsD/CapB family tyrosine-protein kinase [Oscillospiraceae bacterium]